MTGVYQKTIKDQTLNFRMFRWLVRFNFGCLSKGGAIAWIWIWTWYQYHAMIQYQHFELFRVAYWQNALSYIFMLHQLIQWWIYELFDCDFGAPPTMKLAAGALDNSQGDGLAVETPLKKKWIQDLSFFVHSIIAYFSLVTFWITKSSSSRYKFLAVCRFGGTSYPAVQVKHVCIVESRSPSGKLANKSHQRFPNIGNTSRAQKIRVPTKVATCSEIVWKWYSYISTEVQSSPTLVI